MNQAVMNAKKTFAQRIASALTTNPQIQADWVVYCALSATGASSARANAAPTRLTLTLTEAPATTAAPAPAPTMGVMGLRRANPLQDLPGWPDERTDGGGAGGSGSGSGGFDPDGVPDGHDSDGSDPAPYDPYKGADDPDGGDPFDPNGNDAPLSPIFRVPRQTPTPPPMQMPVISPNLPRNGRINIRLY